MLVLTEPTRSGPSASPRSAPRAAPSAAASTGSPTGVPVPCSSTYWTRSPGPRAERRCASRINCSCAVPLGTVSPSAAPSLLTAVPRITPWIRLPSARAADSGLSTTTPPPSPGTKPLARASKVYETPSGDSAPKRSSVVAFSASRLRFTPATTAVVDSPLRRLSHARCTATSDDDCAESTVRLGPRSPRWYETRPAMTPRFTPAIVCWVTASSPYWYSRLV